MAQALARRKSRNVRGAAEERVAVVQLKEDMDRLTAMVRSLGKIPSHSNVNLPQHQRGNIRYVLSQANNDASTAT